MHRVVRAVMTVTAAIMTSAASIHAQGFSISIPTGNNIAQVTNPATGVTYAINKISNTDVRLLTIQPNGSYTTQQVTLPSGYEHGGRSARIDLDANGSIKLGVFQTGTGTQRVVSYAAFDISNPIISYGSGSIVSASTASGRFVGESQALAGEFLFTGTFLPAPNQLDGLALTAWEGANGFGYAGARTNSSTQRFESFIYENGAMSDPFASLNYEAAFIGTCSRFGTFCYGNVTDPLIGDQMYMVNRQTGTLTAFVDQSANPFAASYYAGAREDGWVFGNSATGIWAANSFIWGNEVRPFTMYCTDILGTDCSGFQELNQVTEYFDVGSGEWRSNFAARGSFRSINALSGAPIYSPTTVPEPTSVALLGAGLVGLVTARRWRSGARRRA